MKVWIFLLAATFRAVLWALEDLVGISHEFHSDSVYYVAAATALLIDNFSDWKHYATNNELYVVFLALLLYFDSGTTVLRALNLALGAAIPVVSFSLLTSAGCSKRTALFAAGFVSLLPYQAHLSVHILKDTAFILVGLILVLLTFERRIVSTILAALLLVALRTYLGAVMSIVSLALRIGGPKPIVAGILAAGGFLLLLLSEDTALLILARQEVTFGGREFFENVAWARPENFGTLALYAVVSPVKQLFVPSVLQASGFADLAFGLHVLLYQALFAFCIVRAFTGRENLCARLRSNPDGRSLVVICLVLYAFSASFIDLVTPALGPLVRYRELSFLLLAIASFALIDFSRPLKQRP